jgi:hypothetical protein
MRKTYDADGNVVATSKGYQGGCARFFMLAFLLMAIVGLIVTAFHH